MGSFRLFDTFKVAVLDADLHDLHISNCNADGCLVLDATFAFLFAGLRYEEWFCLVPPFMLDRGNRIIKTILPLGTPRLSSCLKGSSVLFFLFFSNFYATLVS